LWPRLNVASRPRRPAAVSAQTHTGRAHAPKTYTRLHLRGCVGGRDGGGVFSAPGTESTQCGLTTDGRREPVTPTTRGKRNCPTGRARARARARASELRRARSPVARPACGGKKNPKSKWIFGPRLERVSRRTRQRRISLHLRLYTTRTLDASLFAAKYVRGQLPAADDQRTNVGPPVRAHRWQVGARACVRGGDRANSSPRRARDVCRPYVATYGRHTTSYVTGS